MSIAEEYRHIAEEFFRLARGAMTLIVRSSCRKRRSVTPRLRDHIGDRVTYRPPLSAQRQGAPNRIGKIIDEVWAIVSQHDPPKHEHNDPHSGGTTHSVSN
jgi:hypothetical protein